MVDLHLQVGDLATWAEAIGTVGAFTVSLILLKQSFNDKRAGQAKLVAAWQYGKILPRTVEISPTPTYQAIVTYRVLNNSSEPIYNVMLGVMCGVLGTFVRRLGAIGPHESTDINIWLPSSPRAEQYAPDLAFVDAAGHQWIRTSRGLLSQTTPVKVTQLIKEDAGAYGAVSKHPTLRLE